MADSHSWKSEVGVLDLGETQIGSHGLRKRLLKRGMSWQTPFPGDEVEVHYRARIEEHGECFGSSHEEGAPFRFKLGQCEVIKGLDEGIATMKKGERAIFTLPPELGYGELGSPPLIPQNSTLIFDVEMISWKSIRDITGDGGLLKKITMEGEGWATPKDADEVLVKYEAMHQDGTVLSKSMNGVEFCIKNGYLCPAMSKAVKTMRKGEKAELSVKFSYGFTPTGSGSVGINCDAAPNSNLTIHLELLSWKSVIDVTGDGKVLKKIMKVGEGFDHPNEGSLVKVIYAGKLEDGTIFESKGCEKEPFEYVCFEEQIHDGLDRAVMTMSKGEQAVVEVSSDFVSDYEIAGVASPDSVLLYEVELISFTKEKPFWKMGTEEKMEACESKKHEGNLLFKAGKFWRASKKYEKASKYVEFDHPFSEEEKCKANALRLSCDLNNAACKLKLGENLEASKLCTKVLELDPINVKALFRRSQAYLQMYELEKAEVDIKRALAIDPNNRDVKIEYKELKRKQKESVRCEAAIFNNMLLRMV